MAGQTVSVEASMRRGSRSGSALASVGQDTGVVDAKHATKVDASIPGAAALGVLMPGLTAWDC
jgi:NADPH-dependent curcumin reductase CurA